MLQFSQTAVSSILESSTISPVEKVALVPTSAPTIFPYGEEPTQFLKLAQDIDSVSFAVLPLVVERMRGC